MPVLRRSVPPRRWSLSSAGCSGPLRPEPAPIGRLPWPRTMVISLGQARTAGAVVCHGTMKLTMYRSMAQTAIARAWAAAMRPCHATEKMTMVAVGHCRETVEKKRARRRPPSSATALRATALRATSLRAEKVFGIVQAIALRASAFRVVRVDRQRPAKTKMIA